MSSRPVYRPPVESVPERGPCKWRVAIQDDLGLVEDCPYLAQTSRTLAANFEFEPLPQAGEGLVDYNGEFKRDFCLEDLAHNTLATLCKEFMLDVFMLNYACYNAVAERQGEEHIIPMARARFQIQGRV